MATLTLRQWNQKQPIQLSEEQVRRDVRNGKIYPAPKKYGRSYIFAESATRLDNSELRSPKNKPSLMQRMANGCASKNQ